MNSFFFFFLIPAEQKEEEEERKEKKSVLCQFSAQSSSYFPAGQEDYRAALGGMKQIEFFIKEGNMQREKKNFERSPCA